MKAYYILFVFLFLSALKSSGQSQHASGQLIVQLKSSISIENLLEIVNNKELLTNLRVEKLLSKRLNIWLLQYDSTSISENNIIVEISRQEYVLAVQFNHYIEKRSTIPNDPSFSTQWNMKNIGQMGGVPDADIDADEAWDISTGGLTSTGDTIVVAVVDGGIYKENPDLTYWYNWGEIPGDFIDNDNNGYVDDYMGWNVYNGSGDIPDDNHGTHVAGIIGAKGNNSLGVAGVNWNVKVMTIAGATSLESQAIEAYGYVLEQRALYNITNGAKGAFVVSTNSSFGVDFGDPSNFPIWCSFYDSLGAYGILSAGATANLNINIDVVGDIPTACNSDWLISVTNTTRNDTKNTSAAFGVNTIDIGAPGTSILSSINNFSYSEYTGTSMATPHVAGAIALMYAAACPQLIQDYKLNPSSIALLMKNYLLQSVDTLPNFNLYTSSQGRLNLFKALQKVLQYNCSSCIDFDLNAQAVKCKSERNGSIYSNILSGVPPFSYLWSNDSTSSMLSGIPAGNYFLEVTDSIGCKAVKYIFVKEADSLLSVKLTSTPSLVSGTGTASVVVSGGGKPYNYLWNDGASQTTSTATNLQTGMYKVRVTDRFNCEVMDSIEVPFDVGLVDFNIENQINIFPNPANSYLTLLIPFKNALQIKLVNIVGEILFQHYLNKNILRYDINIEQLNRGVYFLQVQLVDNLMVTKKIVLIK